MKKEKKRGFVGRKESMLPEYDTRHSKRK